MLECKKGEDLYDYWDRMDDVVSYGWKWCRKFIENFWGCWSNEVLFFY